MKAARFYNKLDVRVEDVPQPQPKVGEILVDIAWAGICGTDLHEYLIGPKVIPTEDRPHHLTGNHLPITLGHELCGHVSQAPEGAVSADGTPLRVGQPVMVDPRLNCRDCFSCAANETNLCGQWGFLGLSGGGGGGFSETVAVQRDMCYPLPSEIPLDQAVLIEPLTVGRHALVSSGVPMDQFKDISVLVIGGGPVGFSVLCNLRAAGCTKVYVSEPTANRQAQCKAWCSQVFNPIKQNVPEECWQAMGGKGIDVVFDCAGITPGMRDGMDALRPKGTFVNVAGWETDFVIPMEFFMMKELAIRTSMAYVDQDFADVVRDFVAGKFKGVESMITARIALEDVVELGFEALVKHKDEHSKIIATPRADLLPRKRNRPE
ncbi:hypothetical protein LTR37_005771 [Vermiconidia calcicola]|uniref:Uncharacterized protein n=1 Tax=Vermiconidia calcicola TaxID=1690605 RepID=A0ACC3NIA9_9PEZI|nr:hypothetical protein LTR37_005771 [Vermiconidia calcicola]